MAKGFNVAADVLTQTADGRPLNDVWADYQRTLQEYNRNQQTLVDFLTYKVSAPIEDVAEAGQMDFELASEFGEPTGGRPGGPGLQMGFAFQWYDLAARFTWQFLAEVSQPQLDAIHNGALEADTRLVLKETLRTLFSNANRDVDIRRQPYKVYTFYNGDGIVPPAYKGTTFTGSHNHFLTSGAATIDPGDIEEQIEHLVHHGYSKANGYQLVTMVNRAQMQAIRTFRAGVNGATYDFVPSSGSNLVALPVGTTLINPQSQPPATYKGLNVAGAYGDTWIIEEEYIPVGYMVTFATGGPESLNNPIGLREHANPALQGLRLAKGRTPDYPLIDSFYVHGFGTGVRHRGAAVVTQITTSATYTAPKF